MIQMRRRQPTAETENSAFVREMKAALARRLEAPDRAAKRAAEAEMEAIMRARLGATRLLEGIPAGAGADVCTDRKLAAAGVERD